MKRAIVFLIRVALMVLVWLVWWWVYRAPLPNAVNLAIIVGGIVLVYPFVWLGRKILILHPTATRAVWTTTFVHFGLGFFLGIPLICALSAHRHWPDMAIPVPPGIGLSLVIVSGVAFLVTVANLALKGLGAPFFIVLSKKLADEWIYAWTRNPMALAGLSLLLSVGIWFQSVLFVLWVIVLFAPALLFFIKTYEEQELEIRFGPPYLAYKSRTPMLFPRQPRF